MKNFNQIYNILLAEDVNQELVLTAIDIYVKLVQIKFKDWQNVILKAAETLGKDKTKVEEKIKSYPKINSFKDIYKILE